ncbi:MAG: HAD hydrolase-like protein [Caulobacter sp.]|nr:HAD hydrolase-like protein [Vitreoscilla sp.]
MPDPARPPSSRALAHPVIVFDLDGTLSDPLEGIGRSINHALTRFGYPERPLAALASCIGPPLDESFPLLTGRDDPAHMRELVASYRERYADVGYAENVVYEGIPAMLDTLRDHGAVLGVCTSKLPVFAERILTHFGLRDRFSFVSGGDIGVHKWQQLAALRAQAHVDDDAVMVGDRAIDVDAAHRNALHACGVRWGFGSLEELAAARPRYLCEAPGDIVALLSLQGGLAG